MDSCEGCCGGKVCCRCRGHSSQVTSRVWRVQTQPRAIPFDFSSSASNAQIDSISSHSHTRIVSSTSSLFQSRCCTDGNRIYRHSQRPRHGGDDFQAVRPHLACCCAAHRFVLRRELKRRQKQREKEARRAENSANRPPPPNKDSTTDEVANEEDLSPNVRWLY